MTYCVSPVPRLSLHTLGSTFILYSCVAAKPGVFDHVVVNDSVDEAYDDLYKFIEEVIDC